MRRDVAGLRHQGERHFIDQRSRVPDRTLQASLNRLEDLDELWHAIRRRVDDDDADASAMKSQGRLHELQHHIDEVRQSVAQFHHQGERHFADGN